MLGCIIACLVCLAVGFAAGRVKNAATLKKVDAAIHGVEAKVKSKL